MSGVRTGGQIVVDGVRVHGDMEIDGIEVITTDAQLIVDIAAGYDVVVMGADKWAQIGDVEWYTDRAARDAALSALPRLALVPRPPLDVPDEYLVPVSDDILEISSSAVRAGRVEWMTTAAREFHEATGAWGTD